MQPRVNLFPVCCLLLLSIVVSGCNLIEAPPNLATADVLRGPYEAPAMPLAPVAVIPDILRHPYVAPVEISAPPVAVADVLRGAYNAPVLQPVAVADVLRGAYNAPVLQPVAVADVLRGAYNAPAALPVGAAPLADVLRAPYEAPPTVAAWPANVTGWLLFAFALAILILAGIEDFFWRRRHHLPAPTGPPAPHRTH